MLTSGETGTVRVGLVLGAGGTVGLAYHAGALRAVHRVGGFDPNDADLVVGTSAGAMVAAYLRSGWTTEQIWELALGSDPGTVAMSAEELAESQRGILAPNFTNPLDLWRRALGSAYVMSRSVVRMPLPVMPALLRHAFPGGVFAMAEGRRRFAADLGSEWPERPLWICAVNINSGRRVVLGRARGGGSIPPLATLQEAVAASCAIPGLYEPVRIGSMTLVDGGAHSTTNLDLAVRDKCDVVLCVAPMAFDTNGPPSMFNQLTRRVPARVLATEVDDARRRDVRVLLIRPTAVDLRIHGMNLMRRTGWDVVARAAYDSTARMLDSAPFQETLTEIAAQAAA